MALERHGYVRPIPGVRLDERRTGQFAARMGWTLGDSVSGRSTTAKVRINRSALMARPGEQGALPAGQGKRLVVAGFGMVAYKLVERLDALGALGRYAVTIIGEEPGPAYDRVHLTEWLNHRDSRRLALVQPGWSEALGIRIITGKPVVSIDRERHTVQTADGVGIPYDRLILATGSSPFVPPIEGADRKGVFVYRTLDDLERICRWGSDIGSAAVIGGGLLGIEAADALRGLGLEVVLLEKAPCLMSRQLDSDAAAMLEARVRQTGIRTFLGVRASRIESRNHQLLLFFDGRPQPLVTGMIVMAAGIRPRDELARSSGLAVASGRGGVVVDDELRTTDPSIHAIGECASHNGVVYGLVAPGFRMAETLAEILVGRGSRFRGYTPAVRLRLVGIDVWSLGDHTQRGDCLKWSAKGLYRQITLRGKHLVAAASIGPWEEIGFTQDVIRHRRRIWPWQLQQFLESGTFSNRVERRPVMQWPGSAMVCNCLEITRGMLSAASSGECRSVEALAKSTGASTVCGSCRPLLSELIGGAASTVSSKERVGLLTAAVASVLLALIIVADAPIQPATSVQTGDYWDILYRDGWWKQATGFALLGCALVAAGFSLRKRGSRIKWGKLGWWRVGHGAIGALALIMLMAHTGMRLGSGYNRVLMISFLAASLFGAVAAAGLGGRHTRLTFWLHLLAVWPLPVLIVFHVLAVYYF